MDMSIRKHLLQLDGWVPADLCRQALDAVAGADWRQHRYDQAGRGGDAVAGTDAGDRELSVATCRDEAVNRAMMERVTAASRLYVAVQRAPWFAAPARHSLVRFNRYGTDSLMREHCDHISSLFDGTQRGIPILSILTQLNDDFSGGELVFFGGEIIPVKAGTTIVFPSNFLYPHRVERVTAGVRHSCVSWAW